MKNKKIFIGIGASLAAIGSYFLYKRHKSQLAALSAANSGGSSGGGFGGGGSVMSKLTDTATAIIVNPTPTPTPTPTGGSGYGSCQGGYIVGTNHRCWVYNGQVIDLGVDTNTGNTGGGSNTGGGNYGGGGAGYGTGIPTGGGGAGDRTTGDGTRNVSFDGGFVKNVEQEFY